MAFINVVSAQGHACQLHKHEKKIYLSPSGFSWNLSGDVALFIPEQNRSTLLNIPFFPTSLVVLRNHVPENEIKYWISY